ncbi:MAG: hypothetical protein JXA16_05485 [Bacteroidales bacterium]|nr:hypothetical protein [Bacteroidales bacterium]
MKTIKQIFIALCLILFVNSEILSQITLSEIIDKHVEATGLKSGMSNFKTVLIKGKFRQGEMDLPLEMSMLFPNMLRFDMIYMEEKYTKATNGEYDWELSPRVDTIIVSEVKKNPVFEIYNKWTGGLADYVENGMIADYIGDTIIDNVNVYKISLLLDDIKSYLYIDKSTNLLIRVDENEDGSSRSELSDYQKFNGFLLAKRIASFKYNAPSVIMMFDEIEINKEISEKIFNKPE